MVTFKNVNDEILGIKIKKVCLKEIGKIPTPDSVISLDDNFNLNGVSVIDGIEYTFENNRLIKFP